MDGKTENIRTGVQLAILSQHFFPDLASTGQLMTELAIGLRKLGCRVRVLTTHPTYSSDPGSAAFDSIEEIEIVRLASTRFSKSRAAGRILNGVTFSLSAFLAELFRPSREILLIVSNPPILPIIGLVLNLIKGQRYIYLVYDIYPDIAERLGYLTPDSVVSRIWRRINRSTLNRARTVITLSESMKETLSSYMNSRGEPSHVTVIHNWVDGTFIQPIPKDRNWFVQTHHLDDAFVVLYSGNLGLFHDLETVVEAADRLRTENMKFVFIGEGGKKDKLQQLVQAKGLDNVLFFPFQSRETLPYSVTCADVSLVTLERGVERLCMPSKLYTIMASGRPAVALVDPRSDVAQIIQRAECGVAVAQDDVDGFVRALLSYYREPVRVRRHGENGRRFFEQNFTLREVAEHYLHLIEKAST